MHKDNSRLLVALIFGGRGYEREVSVKSAEYMLSVMDRELIEPIAVYINTDGVWLISDEACPLTDTAGFCRQVIPCFKNGEGGFLSENGFLPIDCAIPALHGDYGEDGIVQGALENARIRYVGCDSICGAICSDKAFTKAIAERLGIPVARYVCSDEGEDAESIAVRVEQELSYPVFVKPARLGSSIGASDASSREALIKALNKALELSPHVLIEERIDVSMELECAYFGTRKTELFSGVGKIEYPCGFYDYGAKYGCASIAHTSVGADVSDSIARRIRKYSAALRGALKIRHLSRFDYFLSATGEIIFNEINTFPGFTESSLYPALIERSGISARDMISLLVSDAVSDRA